jgi:hypothetical protein
MNTHKSPLVGTAKPLRDVSVAVPTPPYGHQPICPGCNRGAITSCICDPFFGEGEPDYAAEERVSKSLKQIDWCKQSRGKLDGFERIEL